MAVNLLGVSQRLVGHDIELFRQWNEDGEYIISLHC